LMILDKNWKSFFEAVKAYKVDDSKWLFLTYYAKLTIKMPSKQASIFVIIEIPKAIRRTFY
jgi:putative transposase